MSEGTTTKRIRQMTALRWRQKDMRGVWFWGTWLLMRWNVPPILAGIIGAALGAWLVSLTGGH